MRRAVAVLLGDSGAACPPGVDAESFARAVAEDVIDLVVDLAQVEAVIAAAPAALERAEALRWPGVDIVELGPGDGPVAVLRALAERGADVGAVVAADVPDLPGLVLAKPLSALASAPVAVTPAHDGGLAVLATRLPVPSWLPAVDLQTPDAVERLYFAAPRRKDVRVGPGWHRLRAPADIARLDPELEGWEATRALLS